MVLLWLNLTPESGLQTQILSEKLISICVSLPIKQRDNNVRHEMYMPIKALLRVRFVTLN